MSISLNEQLGSIVFCRLYCFFAIVEKTGGPQEEMGHKRCEEKQGV